MKSKIDFHLFRLHIFIQIFTIINGNSLFGLDSFVSKLPKLEVPMIDKAMAAYGKAQLAKTVEKTITPDKIVSMINEFSPMVIPVDHEQPLDENCLQEGISLMSKTSLVRGLSEDKKLHLLESVGLKSRNIEWTVYKLPIGLDELQAVAASQHRGSSIAFLGLEQYITKLTGKVHKMGEKVSQCLSKFFIIRENMDNLTKRIEQMNTVPEGLALVKGALRTGIWKPTSGALQLLGVLRVDDSSPPIPVIMIGELKLMDDILQETTTMQPITTTTTTTTTTSMPTTLTSATTTTSTTTTTLPEMATQEPSSVEEPERTVETTTSKPINFPPTQIQRPHISPSGRTFQPPHWPPPHQSRPPIGRFRPVHDNRSPFPPHFPHNSRIRNQIGF